MQYTRVYSRASPRLALLCTSTMYLVRCTSVHSSCIVHTMHIALSTESLYSIYSRATSYDVYMQRG